MKVLVLLIFTALFGKGCDADKQKEIETTVIEYTASSRGFYQKITIQNQMVTVSKDRDGQQKNTPSKISDANWNALVSEFKAIDLKELANYKAPTEKRFYDGAAIAELTIKYKDSTYKSANFDHGFPPVEIAKLMNTINIIAK